MTIEVLETAIVAQITALGIVGKPYPENPASYVPDAYPGEVLVRYTGRKPSGRDLASTAVEMIHLVELVYVSQQLRGANGLYEWLEKITARLDGRTLDGAAGWLELTGEEFLDEYNGTWQFGQKWQIKTRRSYEQRDPYADNPIGA